MLVNKKPIAYNFALPDFSSISPVTPEMLLGGYDVPCMDKVPQKYDDCMDRTYDLRKNSFDLLHQSFTTLRNAKLILNKIYNENCLCSLSNAATNRRDRYAFKILLKINPI